MKKFNFRHKYYRKNIKKPLGILMAVIGFIIVIQVIPLQVWVFILGLLLLGLGWTLFKML